MKDKILAALKAKFQGVNAIILDRIATQLAKTVTTDEQVATAVAGVTQDMITVMESYADSRATEAQQTAVRNYEQKHNLKDGKPVEQAHEQGGAGGGTTQEQNQGGNEQTPAWAQALIDSNKQLTERLNKMEGERTTISRKQQLDEILGKLPENLRKGYARTPLDGTDEEWNTRFGEVKGEVDSLAADLKVKGAVFGRPSARGGNQGNDGKLTEAQEKAINQRAGVPAADQQPF